MTAALIEDTFVGSEIHNAAVLSGGSGLHSGVFSATIAAQNDWVVLSEFSDISLVHAAIAGVPVNAVVSASNKITFSTSATGAVVIHVIGTKA